MRKTTVHILSITTSVLLTMAGASLAAISCTKTTAPGTEASPEGAITFSEVDTKAAVEDTSEIGKFSVWGYYTPEDASSTVFDEVTVTREDSQWKYDGLKFWQSDKQYDFYALYPPVETLKAGAADDITCDASGALSITGFDSTKGHDLMTASCIGMSGNTPQTVSFTFSHELALVSFYIQRGGLWETDDDIKVSAELSSVSLKGKLMHNAESSLSSWSELYASTLHESGIMLTLETPGKFIFNNTEDDSLLMIPQNIESVALSVTYSSSKQEEQTRSISITSTTILEWEAGKQYRYTLTIQPNAIVFDDLKADEWGETSSGGAIPVE